MNTSDPTLPGDRRPRLVCRIVRRWCAVFSEHRPGHLATCTSCRTYFAATAALELELRREAARSKAAGPASNRVLEQRILRAIRRPSPGRARAPLRSWVLGGLGFAAAVAIALMLPLDRGPEPPDDRAGASPSEDAAVIVSTVKSLSTEFVGTVIPSAGRLVTANPLQDEFGSVYSDVRSALDFLALNFLPATPVDPPPEPSRRI